jgi:hypothetical protein
MARGVIHSAWQDGSATDGMQTVQWDHDEVLLFLARNPDR